MEKQPMTYELVEFYDREHLENVISLLYGAYAAVTFVCFKKDNEPDERERQMLRAFIPQKFQAEVRFLEVPENSIAAALAAFRTLLRGDRFYHFDICGGSPLFIAAVGMLAAGDGGRRMALHEYDVASGRLILRHPKEASLPLRRKAATLTTEELMTLREIQILEDNEPVRHWREDAALRREMERLWPVVRQNSRAWNNFCSLPTRVLTSDNHEITVEKAFPNNRRDSMLKLALQLSRAGILSDLLEERRDGQIHLSYRLNIRQEEYFLYNKAGNILEMLTALAVSDSGLCTDCCIGIRLDWKDSGRRTFQNPYNEIDVLAIRGHIPYFISCKNTTVTNEHLYEILLMARHFGGIYAIPVMVSADNASPSVRARAAEMGVVLIDAAGKHGIPSFCDTMRLILK